MSVTPAMCWAIARARSPSPRLSAMANISRQFDAVRLMKPSGWTGSTRPRAPPLSCAQRASSLKVGIIKIAEMTNPLTLEPPFQLDEDGAAQHRVGHLLALARDRLWSKCRKHSRLVGIGIATEYAGPRSPPAVDHPQQIGAVGKQLVAFVEHESRAPFLNGAV